MLRPKYYMGLNIIPGGDISPFSVETSEQCESRIIKALNTKLEKVKLTGTCYNEGTREKLYNSDNGNHNLLKRNRYKYPNILKTEFTEDTARKMAIERSKNGKLPSQISTRENTHHWQTVEHSENVSKRNTFNFKGTVTVTDKFGKTHRISINEFQLQNFGNIEDREYVGVSSKEAKRRRTK